MGTFEQNLTASNVYWNLLVLYKGTTAFKERYFPNSEVSTLIIKDDQNVLCVTFSDKPNEYYNFGNEYISNKFSQFFRDHITRITF